MLSDLIYYIVCRSDNRNLFYSFHKKELSIRRLIHVLYLIDWEASLSYRTTVTKVSWHRSMYYGFVESFEISRFIDNIENNTILYIPENKDIHQVIRIKKRLYSPKIDKKIISIVDKIIEQTYKLSWSQMYAMVYSTYPIGEKKIDYGEKIDLVELSSEYYLLKYIGYNYD